MKKFRKNVKSIIASMLLVVALINPIAAHAEQPEILAISDDQSVVEVDLEVDILDGVEEELDVDILDGVEEELDVDILDGVEEELDVDILDGVEEELSNIVEDTEYAKEKNTISENEDVYDLGKGVMFYGGNATLKRLDTDSLFDNQGDSDFEIESYWSETIALKESDKALDILQDFVTNYMPKEYGNVDVFFTPVRFIGVDGFYANFYNGSRNPGISVAAYGSIGKHTMFHELGHHVKFVYYDKKNNNFNEYHNIFKDKTLRSNPSGSKWNTLLTESFAEDFSTYIRYSFEGLNMKQANDFKRTIYPFTEEVIELFDEIFPEIKMERLRRSGKTKEVEKMALGQKAVDNATFSNWSKDDIYKYHYNGLTVDQTNYTNSLTRGQFANMAIQVYELKNGEIVDFKTTFSDTDADYISKAAEVGIINGIGDNKFAPNNTIRREDMFLIIDRLSTILNKEIEIDRTIINRDTSLEEGVAIINRFI